MTDDDELAEARATGRAKGEAAPPLSPALRDYLNTVLQPSMRVVARRHDEGSTDAIPGRSTGDRRTRRRRA